jgi:hypothetical protein
MMRWIVGSSLRFRLLVVPVAAAVLVIGIAQLRGMPVDALPEFTPPLVYIQTEAPGLSAEEVEQLVTVPLEQDLLNGIAWLDQIHSESLPGLSRIELVFAPGTDVLKARQLVQERLIQAPGGVSNVSKAPVVLQPLSSTSRVMMIGLSSKDLSLIDLSVLARWKIRPRLMGVPGVAGVAIWGQRERQLQVQVDPEKLRHYGVGLLLPVSGVLRPTPYPPGVEPPPPAQSINRLEACLTSRCDPDDVERIGHAAGRLRRLQRVRSALQHAGRHDDLVRDLAILGIAWPPADWMAAWERVRGEAADALGVFRDETRALVERAV